MSRLVSQILAWDPRPVHVSLFGSAARGDGDVRSDIDLLVVRPDEIPTEHPAWQEQRDQLAVRIRRWTGNHSGIAEVTKKELKALARRRAPIVASLRSDALTVFGVALNDLLRASR
jgi:hypothetical protein